MNPPTDNDIRECQNIFLSDEFDWDPSMNLFEIYSMDEDYRTISNFYQYVNIVESRVPCAPPTIQCRDYSGIHKFGRSMENVSIGMAQYLMVYILISKFRVKITISGFATYIGK